MKKRFHRRLPGSPSQRVRTHEGLNLLVDFTYAVKETRDLRSIDAKSNRRTIGLAWIFCKKPVTCSGISEGTRLSANETVRSCCAERNKLMPVFLLTSNAILSSPGPAKVNKNSRIINFDRQGYSPKLIRSVTDPHSVATKALKLSDNMVGP